jgi:hypothetical protein
VVRLARTTFDVVVEVDGDLVRVVVTDDDGAGRPELQSPSPHDTSGRGLLIVDRLASAWGTSTVSPTSKTVWFELG